MAKKKKKRADGRFQVSLTTGKKLDGTPIKKYFYGDSPAEAKRKKKKYQDALLLNRIEKSDISLVEWATQWAETYKKGTIKEKSYKMHYTNFIELHLTPFFGQTKLADITPIDIQSFINHEFDNDTANSTLRKFKSSLNTIFNTAIYNDMIYKNPVMNIKLPVQGSNTEKRAYTEAQVRKIIKFAKGHTYGAPIIMLLKTGVRRGELCGIKWSDIKLKKKVLHVQRAVVYEPDENGKLVLRIEEGSNATKNHNRIIPFDKELAKILSKLEKTSDYIFPNSNNEVNNPDNYSKRQFAYFMRDLLDEHPELPHLSIHEFRHTYGTLLYKRTGDLRITQKIMGHSDISTTTIYIHEDEKHLREMMKLDG